MVHLVRDTEDFEEQLNTDRLVLVDFYATWCGPCKLIGPKMDDYAKLFGDKLLVLKVDVDECEELAIRFDISSMPTFIFIKSGETIDTFSGANADELQKKIVQHTS